MTFFIFFCALLTISSPSFAEIGEAHRPAEIQQKIDSVYAHLSKTGAKDWLYSGGGWYGLMGFSEGKILTDLAFRENGKKDVYIIDVGASQGGWTAETSKYIKKYLSDSEKHFHILSLTGGNEHAFQGTFTFGNITQHRLNRFKIENIHSELVRRGFDLRGKVDLIVSNWTLRHLVDPFGTLEDLYQLLTPDQGILMTNGFLLELLDQNGDPLKECGNRKICSTPRIWNIFSHSSSKFVFRNWDSGRDADQFILIKTEDRPLGLPIHYTGKFEDPGRGYQIYSETVTEYRLTTELQNSHPLIWTVRRDAYQDYYGTPASFDTFEQFKLKAWTSPSQREFLQERMATDFFRTHKALHFGGPDTEGSIFIKKLLGRVD